MRYLLIALLFLSAPAFADMERDETYLALVDASRKDVKEARWCKIRDNYYNTSYYAQHKDGVKKSAYAAGRRLTTEKSSEAVAAFEAFMRENAGSLAPHVLAIDLYNYNKLLLKQKKEGMLPDMGKGIHYINIMDEEEAAKALAACATRGTNGKSMDTAHRVADHDEAEAIVQHLSGLGVEKTEAMDAGGNKYEILTVQIPDGGPKQQVWFMLQKPVVK